MDPQKEGRLARSQFSQAHMSDAKWRKLLTAIEEAAVGVREMTIKFIDVDEPRRIRFPPSLACPHAYMDTIEFGPIALRSIEWLELNISLKPLLDRLGAFPLVSNGDATRIIGYGPL